MFSRNIYLALGLLATALICLTSASYTTLYGPIQNVGGDWTNGYLLAANDVNVIETVSDVDPYLDLDLQAISDPNTWKLFYSNGSNHIQEVALGTADYVLTSQGTGVAPSWETRAPSDAQYLVSVANSNLTAEDVVTEGLAIDYTNGSGTGTISFDPTELNGDRTWADASGVNYRWTWDVSTGTDPYVIFAASEVGIYAGARIGGSTNYAEWDVNGFVTLHGDARYENEFEINPVDTAPGVSGATTTNLGNYTGLAFTINDDVLASFEVPAAWDSSTDLTVDAYWYINEAYSAADGEIKWQIDWSATPSDETEAVDAPTHSGTIDSGDVDIPATAKYLAQTEVGDIASASLSAGDLIGLTFSRVAITDGNDPTAEPVMIYLEIHWTGNALGEEL